MRNLEDITNSILNAATAQTKFQALLDGLRHEAESVLNTDPVQTKIGFDRTFTINEEESAELAAALIQHQRQNGLEKHSPKHAMAAPVVKRDQRTRR